MLPTKWSQWHSSDDVPNQAPCLSLVQFQIDEGELVISAFQRSSDANLGLPADIYHLYLMSRQIDLPLKSITLNLANVHIYKNNIEPTKELLGSNEDIKFELNVWSKRWQNLAELSKSCKNLPPFYCCVRVENCYFSFCIKISLFVLQRTYFSFCRINNPIEAFTPYIYSI